MIFNELENNSVKKPVSNRNETVPAQQDSPISGLHALSRVKFLFPLLVQQFDKFIEQVTGIMRAGSSLRMILNRKDRFIFHSHAFQRLVI